MLPGTAQAWVEALTDNRVWDPELDTDRVRRAFVVLSKTARRWPAPVEFLESLPRREQLVLTKQHVPADPEVARRHIAKCWDALGMQQAVQREPGPAAHNAPRPPMSDAARELLGQLEVGTCLRSGEGAK